MNNSTSPQSSLDSIDYSSINDGLSMLDVQRREDLSLQACNSKKRSCNNDLDDLQELALKMMRSCDYDSYKVNP